MLVSGQPGAWTQCAGMLPGPGPALARGTAPERGSPTAAWPRKSTQGGLLTEAPPGELQHLLMGQLLP